jgi:hypothetical protein
MILSFLIALHAFAHGEDKPGPHGGRISMPGAFHIEIVPESSRVFKVYLLDVEWKNPTLKESSITMTHDNQPAICKPKKDFYRCEFSRPANSGTLTVTASRENQSGAPMTYKLPLKK